MYWLINTDSQFIISVIYGGQTSCLNKEDCIKYVKINNIVIKIKNNHIWNEIKCQFDNPY